jgi:predicted nuclease with TOPRIM domain
MAKINAESTRIVEAATQIATIQGRKTAIAKSREKLQLQLDDLEEQWKELDSDHARLQREMDKLTAGDTISA